MWDSGLVKQVPGFEGGSNTSWPKKACVQDAPHVTLRGKGLTCFGLQMPTVFHSCTGSSGAPSPAQTSRTLSLQHILEPMQPYKTPDLLTLLLIIVRFRTSRLEVTDRDCETYKEDCAFNRRRTCLVSNKSFPLLIKNFMLPGVADMVQ